jgi:hypothetical protein
MSTLKKRGDWVEASAYRLEGKMSNFELDFRAYAEAEEFGLELDVDLSMSNLRLIVPADWTVDVRLARNTASNVRDRGADGLRGAKRLSIAGSLSMSNIVVKRRRRRGERRGLFFLLFGPRA